MSDDKPYKRQIRSFVKRTGRMTPAQQRGMEQGFSRYGLSHDQGGLDPTACFGRDADRVLEIGFGMGHAFIEQIKANPQTDFIGIEVHTPGVGSVLNAALDADLQNLVVYNEDAIAVLDQAIPDASLTKLQLFFPDPWPKKRHNKRRIVTPAFVAMVFRKLKAGGQFHMATDWEPYAEFMCEIIAQASGFGRLNTEFVLYPRFSTRFERRGERLGHNVTDLVYQKLVSK